MRKYIGLLFLMLVTVSGGFFLSCSNLEVDKIVCNESKKCPVDYICFQEKCIEKCKKDSDCLSSETCEAGECIDSGALCIKDTDCNTNEYCDSEDARCKSFCNDGVGCRENEVCETEGLNYQCKCKPGLAWDAENGICFEGCEEGKKKCEMDNSKILHCSGGKWETLEDCLPNKHCRVESIDEELYSCQCTQGKILDRGGNCVVPCVVGAVRCSEGEGAIEECNENRLWEVVETCGTNENCIRNSQSERVCVCKPGYILSENQCVLPCEPGETKCVAGDESSVHYCNEDGLWKKEVCAAHEQCGEDPEGDERKICTCIEGSTYCDGSILYSCENGAYWIPENCLQQDLFCGAIEPGSSKFACKECFEDSDCGENEECKNNENCDCKDGYQRIADVCWPNNHTCSSYTDCPEGSVCKDNKCTSCNDDSDCQNIRAESICNENGVCQCRKGYVMSEGECKLFLCESTSQCDAHEICDAMQNCYCEDGYAIDIANNSSKCELQNSSLANKRCSENYLAVEEKDSDGNWVSEECEYPKYCVAYQLEEGGSQTIECKNPCELMNCGSHGTCAMSYTGGIHGDNFKAECFCDEGYVYDGNSCIAIDQNSDYVCHQSNICGDPSVSVCKATHTKDDYFCVCREGYDRRMSSDKKSMCTEICNGDEDCQLPMQCVTGLCRY